MRRLFLAGLVTALAVAGPGAARAATAAQITDLGGFAITTQASAMQITEDFPTAPFHPLLEADLGYTFVSMDQSRSAASATFLYPGSAGANLGALVALLGGPSIAALNDPLIAKASSGDVNPTQTFSAGSAEMTASVAPDKTGDQATTAHTTLGNEQLGITGGVGAADTKSQIVYNPDAESLTATSVSSATNVGIAGVVSAAAVTTMVKGVSVNGQKLVSTGSTVFTGLTIAGQSAYVDATGPHLGSVGNPASATLLSSLNGLLQQLGVRVYFTQGQTVSIGGVSLYYPASILVYAAPAQDPNHDTITATIGGAALSMTVSGTSSGPASTTGPTVAPGLTGSGSGGFGSDGLGALPPNPTPPVLALGGPAPSTLPSGPTASVAPTPLPVAVTPVRLAASHAHGIGLGWLVALALITLVGAALLAFVPGLLAAVAAPWCEREIR